MTVRKICENHGGQCATARKISRLTKRPLGDRTVRKWVARNAMPEWALRVLGEIE